MENRLWRQVLGEGPLVAAAIHDGHEVREAVERRLALADAARRREEDPYTAAWVSVAPTQVVVSRSRFEVDLNRPRARAVYRTPDDAWGLDVWKAPPDDALVERSLQLYDQFYDGMLALLAKVEQQAGRFVVLDLHSYNHRRDGPDAAPADPEANPQVNIGTGTLDRDRWGAVVDRFMEDLGAFPFPGGALDVRENVRFRGGHFSRWIHETFPASACVLAIEFKKFFMDEWTGAPSHETIEAIREALASTVPGIVAELERT